MAKKRYCEIDYLMSYFMILLITVTIILSVILIYVSIKNQNDNNMVDPVWGYECIKNKCVKIELTDENRSKAISLPVCRIFCDNNIGTLWPLPSKLIKLNQYMIHINGNNINHKYPKQQKLETYWDENMKRFKSQLQAKLLNDNNFKNDGHKLIVIPIIDSEDINLDFSTDESYNLKLQQNTNNNEIIATIKAKTYYGARHGLETLSQLIIYDDIRNELQMIAEIEITDEPAYKHRGLLLDTSRNYFSIESIKKTIDAMAMVKLNTFHWHITDSQSFPLVIKSQPDLYKYGAYSPQKIYTSENVKDIVNYGRIRGVRVIPEFDAPAHVGEGWQKKNMTACFNIQPWKNYCVEPPCGQLDPTVDELYNVLEDIYREMFEMFENPDIFHMGGDEVSIKCWNTSEEIKSWMLNKGWSLNETNFMKLWGYFQDNALKRVDKITNKELKIILWTSTLTDVPYIDEYLNKDRYIIQVWTTGYDSKIQELLKRGYELIISNYDALYFDCGGPAWVTDGNNWCSPYIGWQKVYINDLEKISGEYHSQILGAEAALWSEQIDERNLFSRFWPRASALAERLWSNPKNEWKDAESRLLIHRERLIENGIGAEALQPQWCLQNEGECPMDQDII